MQARTGQVGQSEVGAGQVGIGKIGVGEQGGLRTGLTCKMGFMLAQNIAQLFGPNLGQMRGAPRVKSPITPSGLA